MLTAGQYHSLPIQRITTVGAFLEDGGDGLLLPNRFVPKGAMVGDVLEVFVYHDSEDRLIATTQRPFAVVGDIAYLEAVSSGLKGAFLDWGLMKDLFVPKSKQLMGMRIGGKYLVKLYIDEQTGRVAATEKFEHTLSNEELTVKEKEAVQLIVYRRTPLGYVVIINNQHTGLLHHGDVFRDLEVGDKLEGFIKTIREENKIDVVAGKSGYTKVMDEAGRILQLLEEHNGYLPYHDKSDPEAIYEFFGMSKKTFKMTVGKLYKERLVELTKTGIKLMKD